MKTNKTNSPRNQNLSGYNLNAKITNPTTKLSGLSAFIPSPSLSFHPRDSKDLKQSANQPGERMNNRNPILDLCGMYLGEPDMADLKKMDSPKFSENRMCNDDESEEEFNRNSFLRSIINPHTTAQSQIQIKKEFSFLPLPTFRFEKADKVEKPSRHIPVIKDSQINRNRFMTIITRNAKEERIVSLDNLKEILKIHFKGEELGEKRILLFEYEARIFESIIQRKYKRAYKCTENIVFDKSDMNRLKKYLSTKRAEENYKFVFSKCLKRMKECFRSTVGKRMTSKELDYAFYKSYYSAVMREEGIGVEVFFCPTNSLSKTKRVSKTINLDYVANLAKSQQFIIEFSKYMNSGLIEDYFEDIEEKINGLVSKWKDDFREKREGDNKIVLKTIKSYIEHNNKCKLPWSKSEIERAIQAVKKLFNKTEGIRKELIN